MRKLLLPASLPLLSVSLLTGMALHGQATFPAKPRAQDAVFSKGQQEKIKMSRLSAPLGDTAMQYTTVISYGGDSVKAIRIVQNPRPAPVDSTSSDQLELSAGWGGGHSGWLGPSSGIFFIDNFSIGENETNGAHFPLTLYYYTGGDGNVVVLHREDIVYPARAETAWVWLKKLKQKMPPEPLFFRN
jgi:hypothetical protein